MSSAERLAVSPGSSPAIAWFGIAGAAAFLVSGCQSSSDGTNSQSGARAAVEANGVEIPTARLENYTERIPGTKVEFDMIAVPSGSFTMGSPAGEAGRGADEGPQRQGRIRAFWIGRCEVTWREYDLWSTSDGKVDGVTRPTPPYTDMTFGMGRDGYPAICMTQLAAQTYCEWLSKVTGHKYRLPTEAEWEYACRAGTTTAYSLGEDPEALSEYAWQEANSEEEYHEVGTKKPNPWGICDMHGNVAEWTLDQYGAYAKGPADNPLVTPKTLYPRVVRGGSWIDPPAKLRSAARLASHEDWKSQDPQVPKSIWYHTDADYVGFRVVREVSVSGARPK